MTNKTYKPRKSLGKKVLGGLALGGILASAYFLGPRGCEYGEANVSRTVQPEGTIRDRPYDLLRETRPLDESKPLRLDSRLR